MCKYNLLLQRDTNWARKKSSTLSELQCMLVLHHWEQFKDWYLFLLLYKLHHGRKKKIGDTNKIAFCSDCLLPLEVNKSREQYFICCFVIRLPVLQAILKYFKWEDTPQSYSPPAVTSLLIALTAITPVPGCRSPARRWSRPAALLKQQGGFRPCSPSSADQ